ncbi:MAG: shikimate dehydrogenase, partial [Planctomycetia bacterium]|nr:shikimate dehydrogenase [Planctomycetia bacterium]
MTSPALQEIIALFGCPAAGNPAQYLFERAIEAAGLDWRFLTLDVTAERLPDAIAGAAAMGFRGCLLSGPLRAAALPLVATASPAARFSGAVSLIDRQPDGFVGHMTDGRGVVEAVRNHLDPAVGHVADEAVRLP